MKKLWFQSDVKFRKILKCSRYQRESGARKILEILQPETKGGYYNILALIFSSVLIIPFQKKDKLSFKYYEKV